MVRASQPRAAPTTVPIPPRTVEEPHFVDFDFDFRVGNSRCAVMIRLQYICPCSYR
jgi:hypothetical protein